MATYTINYVTRPGTNPLTFNVLTGVVLNGFTGAVTTLEAELIAQVGGYIPGSYDPNTDTFNITGTIYADTMVLGAGGGLVWGDNSADTFTGGTGADDINGGNGNDVIALGINTAGSLQFALAGDGDDVISAGAGLTYITGDAGDDTIDVNAAGVNTGAYTILYGGTGNDTITGSDGVDNIDGGGDNDTITAGDGADGINGGAGTDTIDAGAGNDNIFSNNNEGPDTIDGGAGQDTLSMDRSSATVAFTADFSDPNTLVSLQDGSSVIGVEGVTFTGGTLGDTITSSDSATLSNIVLGGGGNDVLTGGANIAYLYGEDGDDTLTGGSGHEYLYGGAGNDTIAMGTSAGGSTQQAIGGDGADIIMAGAGFSYISGDAGDDSIDVSAADANAFAYTQVFAGTGADTIIASAGTDYIDGGADIDTLSYASVSGPVTVDLSFAGQQNTVGGGLDQITQIEDLIGSNFGDTLTGDDNANRVSGGASADMISAAGGGDTLIGGAGADTQGGGAGNDVFLIAAGDLVVGESIDGGADTDRLEFAAGVHSLAGATLANVEQIALTGSGATTVTLADADQALLFTSSAGSDDSVVYSGDFTDAQFETLVAAGIEHIRYVHNGNANTLNLVAGVAQTFVVDDTDQNDIWETTTYTFDSSGDAIASLETQFDNGISEVISFVNDIVTTTVNTDVSPGNLYTWNTQAFTYDPTGTFLIGMIQTEDNGDTRGHTYTDGTLTQFVFTDVSDSAAIATFTVNYNSGGGVTNLETVYDNGLITATNYTNGVRSGYLQTDGANIYASYHTLALTYAADGSTVTQRIYTADNGNLSITNFAAGGTLTGGAFNDAMTGAIGADTFVLAPNGGNDYIANFENGTDTIDLSAYAFADFAQVQALAIANGPNGIYLSFSSTNHLAINGLTLATFNSSDLLL